MTLFSRFVLLVLNFIIQLLSIILDINSHLPNLLLVFPKLCIRTVIINTVLQSKSLFACLFEVFIKFSQLVRILFELTFQIVAGGVENIVCTLNAALCFFFHGLPLSIRSCLQVCILRSRSCFLSAYPLQQACGR